MGRTGKRQKSTFAKNIILRRKRLGWNAHRLAEEADMPYPTLRDIEAGINAGREDTKEALAKALGCTVSDLYIDPKKAEIEASNKNGLKSLKFEHGSEAVSSLVEETVVRTLNKMGITNDASYMKLFRLFGGLSDEGKNLAISHLESLLKTHSRSSRSSDVAT